MSADFTLCGLRLRSETPLPELPAWRGPADKPVDIEVRLGVTAGPTGDATWLSPVLALASRREAWLRIPSVGDFAVRHGREVTITPRVDPASAELRVFLLGTVFGLLCHQRGLFPLHASAIEWEGQAVAFTGPSGAGKSTLAAMVRGDGGGLLADDVCVIDIHAEGGPRVLPSFPRLKLWRDSLESLGVDLADLERNRPDQEKYHWRVGDRYVTDPVRLKAVYMLERSGPATASGIHTVDAPAARAALLHGQVYRRDAGRAMGRTAELFADAGALADRIAVRRYARDFNGPEAWSADAVIADLAACPA